MDEKTTPETKSETHIADKQEFLMSAESAMKDKSQTNEEVAEGDSDSGESFEDALEDLVLQSEGKSDPMLHGDHVSSESLPEKTATCHIGNAEIHSSNSSKDHISYQDSESSNISVDKNRLNNQESDSASESENAEDGSSEKDQMEDIVDQAMADEEVASNMEQDVDEELKSEEALKQRDASLTPEQIEKLRAESQELKTQGNESFKAGNYTEAVEKYSQALLTCPLCHVKERSIMYSNRAAAFLRLEQNEKAIKDCTKAVELNPNYLKALLCRAELYEKTEKLDEALADYQKALEMDPSLLSAREACVRLPEQINERNEKMKAEMMGKLKDLGNLVLRPFGLSTDNFKLQQDPNTGSYSVQFQQGQPKGQ